jgi:sugar lactone lactonase YvrE
VADGEDHTVRKITPAGKVTTLAGYEGAAEGFDDGPAGNATFGRLNGIAVDAAGNVYVADTSNHSIRKISPTGLVTTIATDINEPTAVAVDDRGNVFAGDSGTGLILRIAPGGDVTTWAETPYSPAQILLGAGGNLYMTSYEGSSVYQVTPQGTVSTVAGQLADPYGLAADSAGNIYVADTGNNRICRIAPDGVMTTVAGAEELYDYADGTAATARFANPSGVAIDGSGTIYVADTDNHCIRRITSGGIVTTLAGAGSSRNDYLPAVDYVTYPYDLAGSADGTVEKARFASPVGLAIDGAGNFYVADILNHTIRKITAAGVVSTIAGKPGRSGYADGTGGAARFNYPAGIAVDHAGNVFVADDVNQVIRRISPDGVVTTLAGSPGVTGNTDGNGGAARFSYPNPMAIDDDGNLYVGDSGSSRIRKITPAGTVSTLSNIHDAARSMVADHGGNLLVTTEAGQVLRFTPSGQRQVLSTRIFTPGAVALAPNGDLYIADGGLKLVRLSPSNDISPVAGVNYSQGCADGTGEEARFRAIRQMVMGADGALYLTDGDTVRVARVALSDTATVDIPYGPLGPICHLGVQSATATSWEWAVIRRPVDSAAELSGSAVPTPTFRPDVPGAYVFRLTSTSPLGTSITTVSFYGEPPLVHPRAVAH